MDHATILVHTDATGLNPPTDDYPGPLDFEIRVSNGTKSKEAHVSLLDFMKIRIVLKNAFYFIFSVF